MRKSALVHSLEFDRFRSAVDEMETISREVGLAAVRADIARACGEAGRDPQSVTLVAVSKTFGAEAIEPVIAEGQRVFGENRVQEAKAKWPALIARHPHLELHLVGSLQSNKAREAVALFDAIHSLDRASLAEALAKEIAKQQRRPLLFVEINTGAESQKAGIEPQHTDAFLASCRDNYGLTISGLMCIPPVNDAPAPTLCAHGADCPPQRACASLHGHERRLPDRDRLWRNARPRWHRDFRDQGPAR